MTARPPCSLDGCTDPVVGRKLCRKHYQAAWKSGDFTNAPLKPRASNRVKCPPEHKHADSSTCYIQHQCRCDSCMDHHSAMDRRRKRDKAYGRFDTGLVDAEPVREHMMLLAEFGIGYKRAAGLAGVGVTAARTILWGRQDPGPRNGELQKRVKRENAEKILAVRPEIDNLGGAILIPARGTHRRIQALVALGWSLSEIGRRTGFDVSNMSALMHRDHVQVSTHRSVAAVFEELQMSPAPAAEWRQKISHNRAVSYAKARRWLPPLAWDDIDMDAEPAAADSEDGIDEIAIQLALTGEPVRLSVLERREAVTRAHTMRWSDSRTAEAIGLNPRTVLRIREELGLEAFDATELLARGAA